MKTINKIIMAIVLMASFASCSNNKEPKVVSTEEFENILGEQMIKATFDDGMIMSFQVKSPSEVALFSKEAIPTSGCVTIPSKINSNENTYQVVEISPLAFQGCENMTSVTIPNSVTSIGNNAFIDCRGLTSVTIPKEVTSAGSGIFNYCTGLTSVIIENGVTEVWESAFSGCTSLNSISIPDGVTSIAKRAFVGCTGLTSISIPNSVTSIGERAFADCTGLTSVSISNSMTNIEERAFANCTGLTSITIPNSVTSIGPEVFSGCTGLTSVSISKGITSIMDDTFSDCKGLTSFAIPEGVTEIGAWAFSDCTGLTSITIPNSVTSIGNNAFTGCAGLTSITIPNGIKSIGEGTFSDCSGLTSITLPSSMTEMGNHAFFSCKGLTNVIIQTQNLSFDYDNVFAYCDKLQPSNVVYQAADGTKLITINDIAGVYFGGEFGGMYLWNDGTWAGGYNDLTYGGTWKVQNNEVKLIPTFGFDFNKNEPIAYDDATAEAKSEILPIDLANQKLGPWTKAPFITEQEIADARKEFETGNYGDNWDDYVDMTFYGYEIVHRMTKEDFQKKKYR